jgi:hypothetical protein
MAERGLYIMSILRDVLDYATPGYFAGSPLLPILVPAGMATDNGNLTERGKQAVKDFLYELAKDYLVKKSLERIHGDEKGKD